MTPELGWFNLSLPVNETKKADADKPTYRIAARDGRRKHGAHGSGILQSSISYNGKSLGLALIYLFKMVKSLFFGISS